MTAVFSPSTFLVSPRPVPKAAISRGGARLCEDLSDVRFDHSYRPPSPRARGVKRLGLEYEQRVADVLSAIYADAWHRSPVIRYSRGGHAALAIPDGLLYLPGCVIVLEVKLAHTELVWSQLMDRYRPLVAQLYPGRNVRTVEVCRSFDPAVPIPCTTITSLHNPSNCGLEVLRWRI